MLKQYNRATIKSFLEVEFNICAYLSKSDIQMHEKKEIIANHQGNTNWNHMWYHLIAARTAVIKTQTITNTGKNVQKEGPLHTVVGNVN